jgi:hypothetical protein
MKIKEFVNKYISPENKVSYPFSRVLAEVKEIFESRSLTNLKEELNDTCFVFQSWLHIKTNWNWVIVARKPTTFPEGRAKREVVG